MTKVMNITEEGRGGGALFRIITVAKALSQEVKTIVICPKESKDYQRKLSDQNIDFEAITLVSISLSLPRLIKYVFRFIPEVIALCRAIGRHRPDVLHVNGSWQVKGVMASYFTKTPCIWHLNDTHQHRVILHIFSLLSRIPSYYIFASEATRIYYQDWIKKQKIESHSKVIQATIDIPNSPNRPKNRENRPSGGLL